MHTTTMNSSPNKSVYPATTGVIEQTLISEQMESLNIRLVSLRDCIHALDERLEFVSTGRNPSESGVPALGRDTYSAHGQTLVRFNADVSDMIAHVSDITRRLEL